MAILKGPHSEANGFSFESLAPPLSLWIYTRVGIVTWTSFTLKGLTVEKKKDVKRKKRKKRKNIKTRRKNILWEVTEENKEKILQAECCEVEL